MTFDRDWVLLISWLPIAWAIFEWRRTQRHLALVLKALSFVAVLVALAEPHLATTETRVALAVLVDTSASVSPADLERASNLAASINNEKGRHWVRVIPFARSTRDLDTTEAKWKLRLTSGESGRATDLEAAVREAVASLPAGMVPRVALISDGKENKGSIARAAWQAQQLGIAIDTFALKGRPEPALRLDSVSLPSIAFTGEQFPIDLVVSAPKAESAEVEMSAEGHSLGKTSVNLQAGENPVSLHAALNTPGALDLSLAIRTSANDEVRFDQAVTLKRPKVLYVSQDAGASDNHLPATLAAAQFDIDRVSDFTTGDLTPYQLIVFNNWDLDAILPNRKDDLEKYVKQGGGLLVIGGERNVYTEGKKTEDALDRTLPAKLAPPRSPEGTAVVIIIDKSSSMEGRKIELARLAAIGVVDNLRPIDMVGVLIFDNSFQWAVPLRRAEDRVLIKRLISGITPDGGTQIAPALNEGFRRIAAVNATFKHIVLLTDGISEEGDSLDLSREAQLKKVTISTVGLGQDVNRAYLEKVALYAGGKSYFLNEPAGLEQILLKDVMEHTGSTAIEKPLAPEVAIHAEILNGTGIETAPPLKGYVKFIAKPTAETILTIDKKDPLLSRWQYGLGRAAIFASDAKARWAADWVSWSGYDKFWTNLSRDLLPHAQAGEASIDFDSANGDLVVEYRLGRDVPEPSPLPEIFVFGPDNFQQPITVKKIATGVFEGRVPIGARQGLFRIRPLVESRAFPEAGLYRPEAELADYGSNVALLKQVADFTGGRFEPSPKSMFDPGRRQIPSSISLWPGLLGLAIALNLAELILRKWKGVTGQA